MTQQNSFADFEIDSLNKEDLVMVIGGIEKDKENLSSFSSEEEEPDSDE